MATLKKAKTKVVPMLSVDDIGKLGKEYADISAQIKVLEEKKKNLADKIKDGAEKFGVKDDKGSYYLENDSHILGKVARKSFKIDQDKAVSMLQAMGIGDVVDVVTTNVVNEERLQRAVQDGRISLDTVEEFTKSSVSYSVLVKEKEVLSEVDQTTLKVAKKK